MVKKSDQDKKFKKDPLSAKVLDLENKWKRAVADYLNLEKRIEKERQILVRLASAQIFDKLLPLLDELEKVQSYLNDAGLKIVIAKFYQLLESEGISEVAALNQKFDPVSMDAVEVGEGPEGTVVKVVNKGYRQGDETLRPAKVVVGKGSAK